MPTLLHRRTMASLLHFLLLITPFIVESIPVNLPTALDLFSVSYVDPLDGISVTLDIWVKLTRSERIAKLEAEIATLKNPGNTTGTVVSPYGSVARRFA